MKKKFNTKGFIIDVSVMIVMVISIVMVWVTINNTKEYIAWLLSSMGWILLSLMRTKHMKVYIEK